MTPLGSSLSIHRTHGVTPDAAQRNDPQPAAAAAELIGLLKKEDGLAAHFYEKVCHELIRRLRNTIRDMGYFKARAI